MAVGVEELTTLRDALIRARAKGVRSVQMGIERIEYRSDAEMASAIADLDARIRNASTARPVAVKVSTSKGI